MELVRRLTLKDIIQYEKELHSMLGVKAPKFPKLAVLIALFPFGYQIWEYSDNRGPLDGDGGIAVVKDGKVIYKHAVWMS